MILKSGACIYLHVSAILIFNMPMQEIRMQCCVTLNAVEQETLLSSAIKGLEHHSLGMVASMNAFNRDLGSLNICQKALRTITISRTGCMRCNLMDQYLAPPPFESVFTYVRYP